MNNKTPTPYNTGTLALDDMHTMYYHQHGNPNGIAVVKVHGGPGGGSKPDHAGWFDLSKYRVILYDQRGCGNSTPLGEITNNTLPDLVEDLEKLRTHLGIDTWMVWGNSFGTTVSLNYARAYPASINYLMLTAVFLGRMIDEDWIANQAWKVFPERFDHVKALAAKHDVSLDNLVKGFYQVFERSDFVDQAEITWALYNFHGSYMKLDGRFPIIERDQVSSDLVHSMRIMLHYEAHDNWLSDDWIDSLKKPLHGIDGVIIHGRYDMCCPFYQAYQLSKLWPRANFIEVQSGHHASDAKLGEAISAQLRLL